MESQRIKRPDSFSERCLLEAKCLRTEAEKLPPVPERDALENKAGQADTAANIDEGLRSPSLQLPK